MGWGVSRSVPFLSVLLTPCLRDTILILDKDNRIVCALVGRPKHLTEKERAEWDAGMASLAEAFEEERKRHEDKLGKNLRGDFPAFAAGFTMGPGASVRLLYILSCSVQS